MKALWTLAKIVVGLAIFIPLTLIVLGTAVALAAFAFRLALMALVAYGAFKLVGRLFRGPRPIPTTREVPALKPVDPYYTAAMRDLDRELGEQAR